MNEIYGLKKKWQIAFRRFILNKSPAKGYNQFYGISQPGFRSWVEVQFTNGMSWDNYGSGWDFDHRVPACYFDYYSNDDLLLFWNFLNVRPAVAKSNRNKSSRVDIEGYYSFFKVIHDLYKYEPAGLMVKKIEEIVEVIKDPVGGNIHAFLLLNKMDWENFYKLPDNI